MLIKIQSMPKHYGEGRYGFVVTWDLAPEGFQLPPQTGLQQPVIVAKPEDIPILVGDLLREAHPDWPRCGAVGAQGADPIQCVNFFGEHLDGILCRSSEDCAMRLAKPRLPGIEAIAQALKS